MGDYSCGEQIYREEVTDATQEDDLHRNYSPGRLGERDASGSERVGHHEAFEAEGLSLVTSFSEAGLLFRGQETTPCFR